MAYTDFESLGAIRAKHAGKKIVFCSGCFDLTHAGHALFFKDCAKLGDILVVMVGADSVIRRDKGPKRPIMNEHLRMKMVDSLKPVDYSFLDRIVSDGAPPMLFIDHVFEKLKPDVYAINTDAFDIPYREKIVARHGTKLVILERTCPPEFEGVSTTKILKKIRESAD